MTPLRAALARILGAVRAGWAAALARWRQGEAAPEVERKRTCWFDCNPDTLRLPKSVEDAEAEAWYRAHFRQRPWTGMR